MDTVVAKTLGKVLRERREAIGVAQIEVSLEAGYSKSYLGMIERGENSPTAEALFRMCAVMDVSLSSVIEDTEKELKRKKWR